MLRPLYHFSAFYHLYVFSTFAVRIQQKNSKIEDAGYFCEWKVKSTEKISTGKKLGADKDKMHQNEIEGALIFVNFFDRIFVTKADGSGIVKLQSCR